MITVILTCWKRFDNFERIIKAWLEQDRVTEVIIFDNSGSFKTDLPVTVFNSSKNYGPPAKFAIAQFASNDFIIFGDDDVVPKPGLVQDLWQCLYRLKIDVTNCADVLVGIMGRHFNGKSYYDSRAIHAGAIKEPINVDYLCGLIMLIPREYCFAVDFKNYLQPPDDYMEDWWLQHYLQEKYKDISFWVAPTKQYELLPEGTDKNALHKKDICKRQRENFFKAWVLNKK